MINCFKLDLTIKKPLLVLITLHLAWLGSIAMPLTELLVIRQLIGFIYLTFVPGLAFMGILKLYKLSLTEIILYSAGLSISFIMFLGAIINITFPLLGFDKPLSAHNLVLAITVVMSIVYAVYYVINPQITIISDTYHLNRLFLPFVPLFLSIFGTYSMNLYNNNILLLLMILTVSLIPFLVLRSDPEIKGLYPLWIFVASVSLLFHSSLISDYVVGLDVNVEYGLFKDIIKNSYWDISLMTFGNLNSMLSVVTLPEAYSLLLKIDGAKIYKIIFPLIYSLVPLGLYQYYQEQIEKDYSFLSAFLFISIFTFFTEMIGLPRQQIAELFLILLLMLVVNRGLPALQKRILLIIFSMGVVVSHYGVTALLSLSLVLLLLLTSFVFNGKITNKINCIFAKRTILLFFVFMISWYIYTSNSTVFNCFVLIAKITLVNLIQHMGNLQASQSVQMVSRQESSLIQTAIKLLNIFVILFVIFGFMGWSTKITKRFFNPEYSMLCFSFVVLLSCCICIPAFSINAYRIYHISLIFLAIFFTLGFETLFNLASKLDSKLRTIFCKKNIIKTLSAFYLSVLLIFNTGFINEVANAEPMSISLNNSSFNYYHTEQDEYSAVWLKDYSDNKTIVEGSIFQGYVVLLPFFYKIVGNDVKNPLTFAGDSVDLKEYVYLSHMEVIKDKVINSIYLDYGKPRSLISFHKSNVYKKLKTYNNVYSNGGSEIYCA